MSAVPRIKRAPAAGVRLIVDERSGVIRGHASLFDRIDLSGDRIEKGAFVSTLRARGATGIRMLWQHDPREPIGVWTTIREDEVGLYVEGKLTLEAARSRDVFALVRAGAVDGLSIGFRAKRARREAGSGIRRLLEIDLWEVSIVTFPMQQLARIAETRGRALTGHLIQSLADGARRLAVPRLAGAL